MPKVTNFPKRQKVTSVRRLDPGKIRQAIGQITLGFDGNTCAVFKKPKKKPAPRESKPTKDLRAPGGPSSYISTIVAGKTKTGNGLKTAGADQETTKNNLKKRAKNREFTYSFVEQLADLESPLQYSYTSTLYCCSKLTQTDDTITAKYCNQRWCMVCNRIRVAKCIHAYLPELEAFTDPQFVTLTVPNCKAREWRAVLPGITIPDAEAPDGYLELPGKAAKDRKPPPPDPAPDAYGSGYVDLLAETIDNMNAVWRKIYQRFKKAGRKLYGIIKLECTYNDVENTYHPHFHFLMNGRQEARDLLAAWMQENPAARMKGQKIKRANSKTIKEVFKYCTKIVTKSKRTGENTLFLPALDIIFQAMAGKQVFRPFGIKKTVSDDLSDLKAQKSDESVEITETIAEMRADLDQEAAEYSETVLSQTIWLWNQAAADWTTTLYWTDPKTGADKSTTLALTGNQPAPWVAEIMRGAVF